MSVICDRPLQVFVQTGRSLSVAAKFLSLCVHPTFILTLCRRRTSRSKTALAVVELVKCCFHRGGDSWPTVTVALKSLYGGAIVFVTRKVVLERPW